MRIRTIADEIETIMRERQWLPWYERYGPNFRSVMFEYPIEHQLPPNGDNKHESDCAYGTWGKNETYIRTEQ